MHVLFVMAYHIGRPMLGIDYDAAPIGLTSLLTFAALLLQPCKCLQSQTGHAYRQKSTTPTSVPRHSGERRRAAK